MVDEKRHAILSASGAHRWINCPPSVKLCENLPSGTSIYAEEGTLAHEICELKVRKTFLEPMTAKVYNTRLNKLKKHELFHNEMLGYTDVYLEYIQKLAHSYETAPVIAVEKKVEFGEFVEDGYGTADCIMVYGDILTIVDFKYGKGVPVSAEHNPQMMLYGIGAYNAFSFLYDIKKIKMAIIQPRIADGISEFEMSVEDLFKWANEVVKPAAELAYKGEGQFKAGEHCRFCGVRAICRERARKNLEADFYDMKLPPLLTDEEVGEALKKAQDLAKWAEHLKEYALAESLKGKTIPGWKAVNGRSVRVFKDTEAAIKKIIDCGIDEELLYERKMYTLAQIEKIIGAKDFNSMVGDLIEKAPGKPTLVLESDKRERITNVVTAEADFKGDEE